MRFRVYLLKGRPSAVGMVEGTVTLGCVSVSEIGLGALGCFLCRVKLVWRGRLLSWYALCSCFEGACCFLYVIVVRLGSKC